MMDSQDESYIFCQVQFSSSLKFREEHSSRPNGLPAHDLLS